MTASPSQTPGSPPERNRQRGGREGSTSSATTCTGPRGLCTTTPREVLARDARRGGQVCDELGIERGVGAAADQARRRDVDVGAQRALEPGGDGLAEARDHYADAD